MVPMQKGCTGLAAANVFKDNHFPQTFKNRMLAVLTPGVVVFGIPNCDSVKKTCVWLASQGISYTFHNFKKQGIAPDLLSAWTAAVGWETLVNRKSTTWRQLDPATRLAVCNAASATDLMLRHPGVIKRPVVRWADGRISVGFDIVQFAKIAATSSL
ncbi:regulatory protein Spx [mine drainage metagenome]|uniref:Regulatory protein Spx n=1 Tax=mine drainage metagenome TaxID=410659 RepID=A0A1J5PHS4_9ZZZZ